MPESTILRTFTLEGKYFQNADSFVKIQATWGNTRNIVYTIYFNPNASEDIYVEQANIATEFLRFKGYGMFLDIDAIVEERLNDPSSASLVIKDLENMIRPIAGKCSKAGSYYFKLPASQAEAIHIQDSNIKYSFKFVPTDQPITENDLMAYFDKRLRESVMPTYKEEALKLIDNNRMGSRRPKKVVLEKASQLSPFYKTEIQKFQKSSFAVAESYSLTAEDTKMVLPAEFRIATGQDAKYFLAAVASDPIVIIYQPNLQTASMAHIQAPIVLAESLDNFIRKSASELGQSKAQVTILGNDHTRVVSYLCNKFEKEGFKNITAISSKNIESEEQLRIAINCRNGKLCKFEDPGSIMTAPDKKRLKSLSETIEPKPLIFVE